MVARSRPVRLALSDGAFLLLAHPPHRRPQSRRSRRVDDRLSAAEPVSGRHHRRARAEPDHPGRHHRSGDRRVRDGRYRRHHRRSRQAASTGPGSDRRSAEATRTQSSSPSTRSGSGRCSIDWSRRPTPARASTTATAGCCSIPALSRRTAPSSVPTCPTTPSGAGCIEPDDRSGAELLRRAVAAATPGTLGWSTASRCRRLLGR